MDICASSYYFDSCFFNAVSIIMQSLPIKHCRACGATVVYRLPDDGDTKLRAVCTACNTVHYENPLNVVGTVPTWGDDGGQVLLCKRNIEPRKGKWTLPAGFMELGETTQEGAARETVEEAGAESRANANVLDRRSLLGGQVGGEADSRGRQEGGRRQENGLKTH